MTVKTSVPWVFLMIVLFLVRSQGVADVRPGIRMYIGNTPRKTPTGNHGHTMHGQHHQHDSWEAPPPDYASKRSTRWDNPVAIARGKTLFQTQCVVCHGADGKGSGPGAKGLTHPPADLTHHFHRAPGDGDAYLFWRVSEGGQVEPFKSAQSTMPAFKTILSEEERWDVLAYVHAQFHRGFGTETRAQSVTGEGTVIAVVPAKAQLVVEHGEIPGFMGAMTMGYPVNPPSLLHRLEAGDTVRFTIDTEQKAIVGIEPLKK
jgi:mono/diheme cytochrome c family protein